MPLLSCFFFNRFKIDPDVTKSYPKSLLEIIKVTSDGYCILHDVREAMRHRKSDNFKFRAADHDQV